MFHIQIPFFKSYVKKEYLYNLEKGFGELEECYIIGVTCLVNKPLLFTIHTEKGAVVSRLPVTAFYSKSSYLNDFIALPLSDLQTYSNISSSVVVTKYDYFCDYKVDIFKLGKTGRYLMSFDFKDGYYSTEPEQNKTFHLIELDDGQYGLFPNNRLLFKDKHFTINETPDYKLNSQDWKLEG